VAISWQASAKVGDLASDERLRDELVSMRFVETHRHVTVVGPVGVGKTFIAHAPGHIACRHKYSVLLMVEVRVCSVNASGIRVRATAQLCIGCTVAHGGVPLSGADWSR
jgi:hypothetical protein